MLGILGIAPLAIAFMFASMAIQAGSTIYSCVKQHEQEKLAEEAKEAQKDAFRKQRAQKRHEAALSKALNERQAIRTRAQLDAKAFATICAAEKAEYQQSRIQRGYYNYGTPWA
jgi:flagellar biosynthesis component FlhA